MQRRGDRGATAIEYALIVGLIAVVALVGIVYVGRSLSGSFEDSTLAIAAAVDGDACPAMDGIQPVGTICDSENEELVVENEEPVVENEEPVVENEEPVVENEEPVPGGGLSAVPALRVAAGPNWKWQCPEPANAFRPVAPETSGERSPSPVPTCVPK